MLNKINFIKQILEIKVVNTSSRLLPKLPKLFIQVFSSVFISMAFVCKRLHDGNRDPLHCIYILLCNRNAYNGVLYISPPYSAFNGFA